MAKSKHELVEEAKAEARKNLSGEDLEKCLTALDNWERNYRYQTKELCSMKQKKTTKDEQEALRKAEEYELIGDLALVSLILVAVVIAIAIIWGMA